MRLGKLLFAIALARNYCGVCAIIWANANNHDMVLLSLAAFALQSTIDRGAKQAIGAAHYGKDIQEDAQATLHWLAPAKNRCVNNHIHCGNYH